MALTNNDRTTMKDYITCDGPSQKGFASWRTDAREGLLGCCTATGLSGDTCNMCTNQTTDVQKKAKNVTNCD